MYQERVLLERAELADKIGKLRAFLFGDVFVSLARDEQMRLFKQYAFMEAYCEILDQRIAAF